PRDFPYRLAPRRDLFGIAHIVLEDGADGVAVGNVEKAKRRDGAVKVEGVEPGPHAAIRLAALQNIRHGVEDGGIERGDRRQPGDMTALVDVFYHDQPDDGRMFEVIVE